MVKLVEIEERLFTQSIKESLLYVSSKLNSLFVWQNFTKFTPCFFNYLWPNQLILGSDCLDHH